MKKLGIEIFKNIKDLILLLFNYVLMYFKKNQ